MMRHIVVFCAVIYSLEYSGIFIGTTVIIEFKKLSLFLLSNFMYFENAVPIRVKLVC
jgi:hypothetical protein